MTDKPLPSLKLPVEDKFENFLLAVVDWTREPSGNIAIIVKAMAGDRTVGVRIIISSEWNPQNVDGAFVVYWGEVAYRSLGDESDQLLSAIAKAYGVRVGDAKMRSAIGFRAVATWGKPTNVTAEEIRLRLFYETEGQEEYAEFYTNVNIPKGRAEIREKDPAFREPVIAALVAREGEPTGPPRAAKTPWWKRVLGKGK